MKTPAGTECRYYFQDFHRGRALQECRLARENPQSARWVPKDCANCPVPGILLANASPNLELKLTIRYRLVVIGRYNEVTAHCIKHRVPIADPHIGCPQCNAERPGIDLFLKALEEDEQDSNDA